jgi:hypothetical protein
MLKEREVPIHLHVTVLEPSRPGEALPTGVVADLPDVGKFFYDSAPLTQ